MAQPTRREYVFPLLLALVMITAGSLPYMYGYRHAGEDRVYMGLVGRDTTGANGYLMLARQALEGHWLFENQMTPEPTRRAYFDLEWLLFGRMARITGLSLMAVFHVWRMLTVIAFMLAAYYLAAQCLDTVFSRRLAVALLVFGSGFGWLIWLFNQAPLVSLPLSLDLQGVTLFGYLINKPHFMRAALLLMLQGAFLIRGETTRQWRYFVFSGLAATALVFIRFHHLPESCLLFFGLPAALCFVDRKLDWNRLVRFAVSGLVLLPATGYAAYSILANVMSVKPDYWPGPQWVAQVLWLGLPFLLTSAHVFVIGPAQVEGARKSTLILGLWLLGAWIMAAAHPFFISGFEVAALALLIVPVYLMLIGPGPALLSLLENRWPRQSAWLTRGPARSAAAVALILVCAPTSGYVYARMFKDLHHPVPPAVYYLEKDVYEALQWLADTGYDNEVVLAAYETSQYIARLTNKKVVSGHDLLAAHDGRNHSMTIRFFREADDDAFKRHMMRQFAVRYVLFGPREREQHHFMPERHDWLREVFRQGDTAIYAVEFNRLSASG